MSVLLLFGLIEFTLGDYGSFLKVKSSLISPKHQYFLTTSLTPQVIYIMVVFERERAHVFGNPLSHWK